MIEHGGDITAKSAPGEGTTILITFPSRRTEVMRDRKEGKNEYLFSSSELLLKMSR